MWPFFFQVSNSWGHTHETSELRITDTMMFSWVQHEVTADWRKSENFLRVWNSACKPTLVYFCCSVYSLAALECCLWPLNALTDRKHRVQTLKILPRDQISWPFLYSVKPFYLVLWSSQETRKPSVQETEGEHRKHPWWLKTKEDLQNELFQ